MPSSATAPLPAPLGSVLRHFRGAAAAAGRLAPHHAVRRCHRAARWRHRAGEPDPPRRALRPHRASGAHLGGAPRPRWLAECAHGTGGRSEYRLSASGAARFAEATQRIYAPTPAQWNRRWTLLLLPPGKLRPAGVREALRWHGFGQLHAALFAHPGTTPAQARAWLHDIPGAADALLLESGGADAGLRPQACRAGLGPEGPRRALCALRARASSRSRRSWPALSSAASAAFLVRTLLIHEYRKVHLQDPLLPPNLLPADWVGTRAYETARRIYGRGAGPGRAFPVRHRAAPGRTAAGRGGFAVRALWWPGRLSAAALAGPLVDHALRLAGGTLERARVTDHHRGGDADAWP